MLNLAVSSSQRKCQMQYFLLLVLNHHVTSCHFTDYDVGDDDTCMCMCKMKELFNCVRHRRFFRHCGLSLLLIEKKPFLFTASQNIHIKWIILYFTFTLSGLFIIYFNYSS